MISDSNFALATAPLLDQLLIRADIWRGATPIAVSPAPTCGTGFAPLDAQLPGGGWPRGQMTEVLATDGGVCGAGELSLLTPALARLTEAGGKVVVIFPWPCGWRLHAPAWVGAGVAAGAMLLVRPQNLRDMVWAAVQSARCPGVGAVLCWLDARVPTNSLRRLQVAAGEGGACLFVIRPSGCRMVPSPAPLRLAVQASGAALVIELIKRRGAPAGLSLTLRSRKLFTRQEDAHALVRADTRGARSAALNDA